MTPADVRQLLAATAIDKGTYTLLKANGESDRQHGIDMHKGWEEVATHCGYPVHQRTPAREAYEDGYYGV